LSFQRYHGEKLSGFERFGPNDIVAGDRVYGNISGYRVSAVERVCSEITSPL
jgi:hypothetical protein